MFPHTENQSWVVNRGGDVIEKKSQSGEASLNDWERLVYCLWLTDYMMRNAGDFANAKDNCPDFQSDAAQFANSLGLPKTYRMFSLSRRKLQMEYFDHFEAVCDEIKSAEHDVTPHTPIKPASVSIRSRLARWLRRGSASGN